MTSALRSRRACIRTAPPSPKGGGGAAEANCRAFRTSSEEAHSSSCAERGVLAPLDPDEEPYIREFVPGEFPAAELPKIPAGFATPRLARPLCVIRPARRSDVNDS